MTWHVRLFPDYVTAQSQTDSYRNKAGRVLAWDGGIPRIGRIMDEDDKLIRLADIDVFRDIGVEPNITPSVESRVLALQPPSTRLLKPVQIWVARLH